MNVLQFIQQNRTEVLELTAEHLWLVGASIALAVLIGIPLGILITRWPVLGKPVLGGANIIQTIPSLALFGFLLPAPWIGARADRLAILALTLYALLPLIRNTYTGIRGVDPAIVEAGRGMGMTDRQLLWQVEFPLALSVIIAGIRVATVLSIGVATIAAAIGAGGLGEYIFRGLAMVNNQVILAGAIPAAGLAILADTSLGWLEKRLGPAKPASLSSAAAVRPAEIYALWLRASRSRPRRTAQRLRAAARRPHRHRHQEFHRTTRPRRNHRPADRKQDSSSG